MLALLRAVFASVSPPRAAWILSLSLVVSAVCSTASAQPRMQQTFEVGSVSAPTRMDVLADGGVVLGSTVDGGSEDDDIYLLRTDETGAVSWIGQYGSVEDNELAAIREMATGDILVGGNINRGGYYQIDGAVFRLNAQGSIQWGLRYQSGHWWDELVSDMILTEDGGALLVGAMQYNPFYEDKRHFLVIKIGSDGSVDWSKAFVTRFGSRSHAWGAVQTSDGGFVITGTSSMDSVGARNEGFLLKLDGQGNRIWSGLFDAGVQSVIFRDVIEAWDGSLVIAGAYKNSSDNATDLMVAKFGADGTKLWAKAVRNNGPDEGLALAQLPRSCTQPAASNGACSTDAALCVNDTGEHCRCAQGVWSCSPGDTSVVAAGTSYGLGPGDMDAVQFATDLAGNVGTIHGFGDASSRDDFSTVEVTANAGVVAAGYTTRGAGGAYVVRTSDDLVSGCHETSTQPMVYPIGLSTTTLSFSLAESGMNSNPLTIEPSAMTLAGSDELCLSFECPSACDGDACNTGSCDTATGTCVLEPVSDGTSCDDSDSCTTGDQCLAGVCESGDDVCGGDVGTADGGTADAGSLDAGSADTGDGGVNAADSGAADASADATGDAAGADGSTQSGQSDTTDETGCACRTTSTPGEAPLGLIGLTLFGLVMARRRN